MGNGVSFSTSRIAEDFDRVKMAHRASSMSPPLAAELTITPEEPNKEEDRPCTVLVRRDVNRQATIIFDQESMMPLYITTQKREQGVHSVTTDRHGRILYLTTAPRKGQRLIFKAPCLDEPPKNNKVTQQPKQQQTVKDDQDEDEDDRHQSLSYATPYKKNKNHTRHQQQPHSSFADDDNASASSSASSTTTTSSTTSKGRGRMKKLFRFSSFRLTNKNNKNNNKELQRSSHSAESTTSTTSTTASSSSPSSLRNLFGTGANNNSHNNNNNNNNNNTAAVPPVILQKPTLPPNAGDLPCAAQIELDFTKGSTLSAFLSIVCWKACGPEPVPLYKGIRIPNVNQGVLIVHIDSGHVVGKAFQPSKQKTKNQQQQNHRHYMSKPIMMEPVIQIAAGADRACVVALASALLGDL